jgi:dipeptidyl aminopeptidase/acylaminoacyl peptidase
MLTQASRYNRCMRFWLVLLGISVSVSGQKEPFTADAMMKIVRISEPQLSPDGQMLAFTAERVDLAKNTKPKDIFVMPLVGGSPVQVTHEGTDNERARWTPDSKQIVFISDRSGSAQIWIMQADGADPKEITSLSTEAGGVTVAPNGKLLVFTSNVYPECSADEACNKTKIDAEKANPVKARIVNSLLYRHWKTYQTKQRSHLLVVAISGGPAKDLTPGPFDVPTFTLEGSEDYAISPDSNEVAYVSNTEQDQALSTNTDIFTVPIAGGEAKKVSLNPGGDRSPVYSPDGKYLAFRSQLRPGYESDRWRLAVVERATGHMNIIDDFQDRPVEGFTWSTDSSRLFYTAEDRGRASIQMISATGGGVRVAAAGDSHMDDIQFAPDGKTMIFSEQSGSRPTEIFRASSAGGSPVPLTHLNDAVMAQYQLTKLDEFWVDSPDQTKVQSFVVKPPNFDATKKYPVLFLIHGGPQSAWGESWTYRWNAQVFAAAGFVVVMPNPRGSIGYGQKFTDDINQDWGGKPYDDIMAVADYVEKLPYIDGDRMSAAGGSYGGYMVDWLLGHTQRFKALVSHSGVFDLRSEFGETEELWFPLWEFRGTPWDNPDIYAKFSPSSYIKDFKTPTLVMHGELDYRVPVGQGMQLFTALQMQKIPSKMVLFPDEGHWILKPQNSLLWYSTVLEWIGEWTARHSSVQ